MNETTDISNTNCNNILRIVDFDSCTVETFLNYLYTDTLDINSHSHNPLKPTITTQNDDDKTNDVVVVDDDNDDAEDDDLLKSDMYVNVFIELFKIADKYSVYKLKQTCEQQLGALVGKETCVELLILAYLHSATRLKKRCFGYLTANLGAVVQQPAWTHLEKNYPGLLAEAFRLLYFKQKQQQPQSSTPSELINQQQTNSQSM
jgi:hypothetical protein